MSQKFSSEFEGNLVISMCTRLVLGFECFCMQIVVWRYMTCKVRDIIDYMVTDYGKFGGNYATAKRINILFTNQDCYSRHIS